ncbi:MAG TPA: 2-phospho-L-lactate guanylyltransferase [Anaerolineaceae bacterium]|nr:2-phospho-L-lactate guanylyltransferase [Anaerolineaceae bacterium]
MAAFEETSMGVWAIVPVKPLRRGKSRLASVLSATERALLNQNLLLRTLQVLSQVEEIEQVLVVSRDSGALALARRHGARTLQERGDSRLNLALRHATTLLQMYHVGVMMILPADLPLLEADDVRALLAAVGHPPSVVLAPDRHGEGTNALVVAPPGLMPYQYGPGSFARHVAAAREAGVEPRIVERQGLAWDLDWPEDLEALRAMGVQDSLREVLRRTDPPSDSMERAHVFPKG